jgi:carboxyl-terminal processing protease
MGVLTLLRALRAGQKFWLAPSMLFCLLLVACAPGGASSALGDPAAARRAAAAEGGQQAPASTQRQAAPAQLLSSTDISIAYHFILNNYVDQLDYVTLIEAARAAVAQNVAAAGALPIDSAPMDLFPLSTGDADRDWDLFSTSLAAVIQRHPDWSLQNRPDYLAIRTMLETLKDSHSTLITADDARRQAESAYSGIGVRLTRQDLQSPPMIVEVFPSSPAAGAGVRAGDRIIAVNDRSVTSLALSDIAEQIRGPQGSEVVLQLDRTAAQGPVTVRAVRRPITTPVAEGKLIRPRIGYIRVRSFGDTTPDRVGALLTEWRPAGLQGLLLDLRGNPGGSIQAVTRVAGYFMSARPIGITVDRTGQREEIVAEPRPLQPSKLPLVVLIDGDSGSGSEILAASLRDYQLATVVGQKSAGSVNLATDVSLSDGSAIRVTVRRLLTSKGAQLDGAGVEPDESVPLSAQDLEAGRDPQLNRALALLEQRLPHS